MNILVIGGAGYIGSHVTRAFLDKGHSVHVFDNLSSGLHQNFQKGAGFTHGDINFPDHLRHAMAQNGPFDAVIHLAAFKAAGESMIKPEKYSSNNLGGTINILNAMSEAGIKRIVFSSSAAVYGEPQYLPIDEKHPCNPENYYGFTKLEIERILGWYSKLRGLRFAALRYFNAAGYDIAGKISGLEQGSANLLPVIMDAAVGLRARIEIFGTDWPTPDGTGVRDYVHVSDLADAHVRGLEYIATKDKDLIVNLGSENGISVREIVDAARRISGKNFEVKESPRRAGDPAKLVASSAYAASVLGWKAKHSDVETLVRSTWDAYRRNGLG